jgi:hypothetical protein
VACLACLQVAFLFGLSVWAPVAMFYLGPVIFGVVHLAADVRYLILHRSPPRTLVAWSVACALAITAVQVGVGLHAVSARSSDQLTAAVGVVWVGFGVAFALREARALALLAVGVTAAAAWLAVLQARWLGLAMVHGHNLVALAIWLALFRRRVRWATAPIALVVGLGAVLLSGRALGWTFEHGGLAAFGTRAEAIGAWLAPGARPDVAVAVVGTFVFLQGVHYAAWTTWIAQDDLRTEGTPTYRMSVRALERDFGRPVLLLVLATAVGFALAACVDLRASVGWYLVLAKSHGWLELAFVAYFLAVGERLPARAA